MSNQSQRIQRAPNLAMQVHEALLDRITSGALQPGDRIVIDRLAMLLGVSPTPVREAVARLMQEGLVTESGNGRLQIVALTEQYVVETFLVRSALEGLATELAAPRLSADQRTTLRALLTDSTTRPKDDHDLFVRTDATLHRIVLTAAANRVLDNELRALQPHIDLIRGYSQRNNGVHLRESHQEHLRIINSLVAGDGLAARQAMEDHIRSASMRIVQLIDFQTIAPGD